MIQRRELCGAMVVALSLWMGLQAVFPDPPRDGYARRYEPQQILPLESEVYRYLRGMALEAGVAPPSSAYPFTAAEVRQEWRRLSSAGDRRNARPLESRATEQEDFGEKAPGTRDGDASGAGAPGPDTPRTEDRGASAVGSEAVAPRATREEKGVLVPEGIRGWIFREPVYQEGKGGFSLYSEVRLNAETYLHANRDYDQWVYDARQRQPFLGVLWDASFFRALSLYVDMTAQKDPFQTGGDPHNYTSVLTSPYHFDLNMPYRAGLSVGGERWNLWLGRDKLSWGNGRSGNLLLSDADLYHEGVRFTTFWERFKFTFLLLGLESWRMAKDERGNPYPWPDDSGSSFGGSGSPSTQVERFKMFLAHRVEISILSNLRLSLTESIVYGGKYPDLRVFNPLVVYHNLYIKEWSNSLMTVELDYVPFPGVYLYGQYAQDQLSTIFEKAAYGTDAEPNAMGYLVGIELQRAFGGGRGESDGGATRRDERGWLRGGYEFVKTDPWLYIRETPYVSFVSTRRVHSEARKQVWGDTNQYFLHTPLGYLHGPDVILHTLWISYEAPAWYRLFLEYTLLLRGENRITTRFQTGDPAWALDTPSGTVDTKNVVTMGACYSFSSEVEVFFQPSFVYNTNVGNQKGRSAMDFQIAAGVRYRKR